MRGIFFKKQRQVESLIYQYLDNIKITQEYFANAVNVCLEKCADGNFDFLTEQTHKFESKADDIREEIKTLMYGKALIPESRGDIMGLMEAIDAIPSLFQLILYMIKTQKLVIPDFIATDIKELIEVSLRSCDLLVEEVEELFKKGKTIREIVAKIDLNESHCDHIERRIITKIFDSDIDPFIKLQLNSLVVRMGDISDHADRVSKRVNIISMKRRV